MIRQEQDSYLTLSSGATQQAEQRIYQNTKRSSTFKGLRRRYTHKAY
jgi:hypothetical protein